MSVFSLGVTPAGEKAHLWDLGGIEMLQSLITSSDQDIELVSTAVRQW
jgi:hypothetical protein